MTFQVHSLIANDPFTLIYDSTYNVYFASISKTYLIRFLRLKLVLPKCETKPIAELRMAHLRYCYTSIIVVLYI